MRSGMLLFAALAAVLLMGQPVFAADNSGGDNANGQAEASALGAEAQAGNVTCQIASKSTEALVIRVDDGFTLGTAAKREDCFNAVRNAQGGVVCGHASRNLFGVFRISDGVVLGQHGIMTIAECTTATSVATNGTVCVKADKGSTLFNKVNIENGFILSTGLSLDECTSF